MKLLLLFVIFAPLCLTAQQTNCGAVAKGTLDPQSKRFQYSGSVADLCSSKDGLHEADLLLIKAKSEYTFHLHLEKGAQCFQESTQVTFHFANGKTYLEVNNRKDNCNGDLTVRAGGKAGNKKFLQMLATAEVVSIAPWSDGEPITMAVSKEVAAALQELVQCMLQADTAVQKDRE